MCSWHKLVELKQGGFVRYTQHLVLGGSSHVAVLILWHVLCCALGVLSKHVACSASTTVITAATIKALEAPLGS